MTTRACLSTLAFVLLLAMAPFAAHAEEVKPDDTVTFDLSTESWVTTKSALVNINVAAAVSSANAGTTRAAMIKAVNDIVKADWRLTSFNRMQDSTGMERWSATYESRIAENELNGLAEKAKGVSKTGLQLMIGQIDFSPTLEETQTTLSQLRTQIYKQTNDQLAALNTAMTGRTYRIAAIDFNNGHDMRMAKDKVSVMMSPASDASSFVAESQPMERAKKLVVTAHITMAADPKSAAPAKQ